MSEHPPFDPHPPAYVTPVPSLPKPPPMPTDIGPTDPVTGPPPSPLDQIEDRISKVEDALYLPNGVLHALFANLLQIMKAQHEETMRTLTTLANGMAELSDDVAHLKPDVERHDVELRLLELRSAE